MKSKKLISSIIVITITIALIIMFTSGSDKTDQTKTVSSAEDKNLRTQSESRTEAEQKNTAQIRKGTQGNSVGKPVHRHKKSSPTTRTTKKSESDSATRLTRVKRPGQKYRMVRVDTVSAPAKK